LIHLVPEVLTGKPVHVDARKLSKSCRIGPVGESAFAGGATGAADGNQGKRLANREPVTLLGRRRFMTPLLGGTKSTAGGDEVTVNYSCDVELAAQGVQRSNGSMRAASNS